MLKCMENYDLGIDLQIETKTKQYSTKMNLESLVLNGLNGGVILYYTANVLHLI